MKGHYEGPSCTNHGCIVPHNPNGVRTNGACHCADFRGRRYIKWLETRIEQLEQEINNQQNATK